MKRSRLKGCNLPREDSAGEEIYDQVDETLHVIDGAKHGDISMPDLIRTAGSEAGGMWTRRGQTASPAHPASHTVTRDAEKPEGAFSADASADLREDPEHRVLGPSQRIHQRPSARQRGN